MKKALTCFVFLLLSQNLWAQDEATSVVWGMPGFVSKAGLADKIIPLDQIAFEIIRKVNEHRSSCQ